MSSSDAISPEKPTSDPRPRGTGSLRTRAMRGAGWTLAGYVGAQGVRLVSNVILAKLLFPSAFGLMALVGIFMQGLQMFSDIGIAPSIIQNERGDDPRFLNTAWTIQVGRGFMLWLVAIAGAVPFARFYGNNALIGLIAVSGVTAFIGGFTSTSIPSLNRHINLRRITSWEIGSQVVGVVVMIAWALIDRSVWALVAGGIATALYRTVASHFLVPGHRNWFGWDRTAVYDLFTFGRWIFISTVLTFFALQLDKLLLGKVLDEATLGVYYIAAVFSFLGIQMAKKVGGRVVFPALSEINRERPEVLYRRFRQARLALLGACLAALVPMSLLAPWIIDVLYDPRYANAGWMLQLLAAGAIVGVVSHKAQHIFMALAVPRYIVVLLSCQLVMLVAAVLVGNHYAGVVGVVAGIAAVELLNYPVLAVLLWRLKMWQPEVDAPLIVFAVLILLIGVAIWGWPTFVPIPAS